MKKNLILVAAAAMMLVSCGSTTLSQLGGAVLGDITGTQSTTGTTASTNTGDVLGNILNSVITGGTVTQQNLIGTWTYSQPGCAFSSDNLLAKAGGEVAAAEIKSKLSSTYQKVGIKSSNTTVTFKEDGTFTAKIAGKGWSGNYTFDEKTSKITMQGLLINANCYAKKNSNGIALLFESTKLLTLLQTMSAMSGNSSVQAIGDLSKNYDGLRLGFDFK